MEKIFSVIIYLGIAIFTSLLIKKAFFSKSKINQYFSCAIVLFLPSLLAAFRGNTGVDSSMYRISYGNIDSVSRWQNFEKGYVWLVKLLNGLGLPYQMLFFVMEFLTILFFLLFLNNEKKNVDIKIAMFVFMCDLYMSSFNIMRQALAITIVLYAFSEFMNDKYAKSIVVILFACLFHGTALLGLAVIGGKLLFQNRFSKPIMLICFAVILYFVFHRELLGKLVYSIIHNRYYASYITRNAASDGSYFGYILKCTPVLVVTLLSFKSYDKNTKYKVYSGLMIGGYIISLLGVMTATQVQRVGYYYIYLNSIILAYFANYDLVLKNIRIKKNICQFFVVIYVLMMFFYNYAYRNFGEFIPYQGLKI